MGIFDDQDAMYRPRRRDNADRTWGVWDKASECFIDTRDLTLAQATAQATYANDNNSAADDATWD